SAVPPIRLKLFSSRNRNSLACSAGTISPISSRNTVPPSALSSSPRFCNRASVNAPRSWPNSSLSSNCSGSAEQVMFMNGRDARQRGEQDHQDVRIDLLQLPEDRQAVHVGQPVVQEDEVHAFLELLERLAAGARLEDVVALRAQPLPQRPANQIFVVDDQDG